MLPRPIQFRLPFVLSSGWNLCCIFCPQTLYIVQTELGADLSKPYSDCSLLAQNQDLACLSPFPVQTRDSSFSVDCAVYGCLVVPVVAAQRIPVFSWHVCFNFNNNNFKPIIVIHCVVSSQGLLLVVGW
jgi:hypothetical protein